MGHVLVELVFKVHRGLTAGRAVEPRPVVKDFDPPEDGRVCELPANPLRWRHRMKINSKNFRVSEGGKIRLKNWPTKVKNFYKSKDDYKKILGAHVEELR